MSLGTAYTAYTSDEEIASSDLPGATAPASTPLLANVLVRGTVIAAKSSTMCAAAIAGGSPNVFNTIKRVC